MPFSLSQLKRSITKTVESGAFIRTVIREGKRRKQKTRKFKKNENKVVLGHIGDFEVYVYPYNYPDRVFIGQFPISTEIENSTVACLISAYNKSKTYLDGYYFSKPKRRKGTNVRRQAIQRAYNNGLNEQISKEKASLH